MLFGAKLWKPRRIQRLAQKVLTGEIRRLLFDILENENEYIETLIKKKLGLAT